MLGRMIVASKPLKADDLATPPDYIVTTAAEWATVFANDPATLSGKVVEVAAPITEAVQINGKDMHAAGAPVTIRSANAGSYLARLEFYNTVRGVDFSGMNFQMVGWPHTWGNMLQFGTGTFGKIRFLNGTTFRHGYGAGLEDIDTTADLPEYTRTDNVQTATTSSAAYALTWRATDVGGNITFFNRGAVTVYVAVGGSGVTATTGSTAVAAGADVVISNLVPATDTHFAILSASSTSQVNARTEQGLARYLADAMASSGSSTWEDVEFRNCLFRDVNNGAKGIQRPASVICMDCDFDRIYADTIALPPQPGGKARIMRNLISVQFCRSGIPENLNGDAGDPHGDVFQMFGIGDDTISDVIIAGNWMRATALRAGVTNQGLFISDNDTTPSFSDIYMISNTLIGGSPTSLATGEGSYPVRDYLIYGVTIVDYSNAANVSPRVDVTTADGGSIYTGSVIAPSFLNTGGEEYMKDGNLVLTTAASPAAVFPNLADLATATTRAEIEAALTTAAEGAGIGAIATKNAVDWTTTDPEAVVLWQNVPSGAHWNTAALQDADTLIALPLRKILNPRADQAVSVGASTEWRSVDTDGTTEVQAWTSSPGTIQPGQSIQIRRQSSATGGASVTASVTINGFTQDVTITTALTPSAYLVQGAGAGFFRDTANIPASTTRLTFRGKFYFPSGTLQNGDRLFSVSSTGADLALAGNNLLVTVEDSSFGKVINVVETAVGTILTDQWLDVVFDVNLATDTCTVTVNGEAFNVPFGVASTGLFQTGQPICFLGTGPTAGTNHVNQNVRVADLSVDRNGVLRKAISNVAATANADAWQVGGDFTSVP